MMSKLKFYTSLWSLQMQEILTKKLHCIKKIEQVFLKNLYEKHYIKFLKDYYVYMKNKFYTET